MCLTLRKPNTSWNKWILEPVGIPCDLGQVTHLWISGVFFYKMGTSRGDNASKTPNMRRHTCQSPLK